MIYDIFLATSVTKMLDHNIKKWFAEGKDIASMLPVLSGYMGHTSLEDTAYYIHLVPEHLTDTGLISWNCIPEVPAYED